jgi:ABC-type branched-subunit amino acid transport system ATPase component
MALEMATHAYVLDQGHVIEHGSGRELQRDDRVREAYLGHASAGTSP